MIDEIKRLYQTLGDAVINNIQYTSIYEGSASRVLSIYAKCLNWETEEWQKVKFTFENVSLFQYLENLETQSSVVFEALIIQGNSHIVVDFFPIQVDGLGKLEEDSKSSFLIHCETIKYEVID